MSYLVQRASGLVLWAICNDNGQEFENSIGVIL